MSDYPPSDGTTLRAYQLGFADTGSQGLTVEPVVVGPFTVDVANYYLDEVFKILLALPEGNKREWRIMMRDTNPSGDFPDGAEIDWQCIELPKLPVPEANAMARKVLGKLKAQPAWSGGGS